VKLTLSPDNLNDYQTFLKVKALPRYRVVGRTVEFPDEYAQRLGLATHAAGDVNYTPLKGLFDYQRDISKLSLTKQKFAVFVEPGYGKTLIMLEYARAVAGQLPADKCVLIVSPLMVVRQTIAEAARFYGDKLPLELVTAKQLPHWMGHGEGRIGITNYDGLTDDVPQGRLGALILDESGMLKSAYGNWAGSCIRLGKGLDWKLALTGTPAPNDRIEFANHAVFLDQFPTVNSFLARFFVNRGQTDNRWELKPHALVPFYRALSHWSIFMQNPATYGWRDNAGQIPPVNVHVHDVPLTQQQQNLAFENTGRLFADQPGGITSRSVLSQIAKGSHKGQDVATNKTGFIRSLVESWPGESTLIWCLYNREQELLEKELPGAASLTGATPEWKREEMIARFQAGEVRTLISKPKILGLGLNLQIATRQIFSGLQDSYESFWQGIKRSNRVGSTMPLNVHIPVTDIEKPMIETVLAKARRVQRDAEEQERIFKLASTE
jgi:superfamily II DNA or RNA helicase